MSISNLNSNITLNEEALTLRQIFNSLEENKRNNKEMNNNDKLLKKYNIKINSDFVNLMHNIKNNNKNRYKFKLQKTFCKNNI